MDFWTWLGYILSLFHEIFYINLFSVNIPSGDMVNINVGSVMVITVLLGVIINLLTPSARGT